MSVVGFLPDSKASILLRLARQSISDFHQNGFPGKVTGLRQSISSSASFRTTSVPPINMVGISGKSCKFASTHSGHFTNWIKIGFPLTVITAMSLRSKSDSIVSSDSPVIEARDRRTHILSHLLTIIRSD